MFFGGRRGFPGLWDLWSQKNPTQSYFYLSADQRRFIVNIFRFSKLTSFPPLIVNSGLNRSHFFRPISFCISVFWPSQKPNFYGLENSTRKSHKLRFFILVGGSSRVSLKMRKFAEKNKTRKKTLTILKWETILNRLPHSKSGAKLQWSTIRQKWMYRLYRQSDTGVKKNVWYNIKLMEVFVQAQVIETLINIIMILIMILRDWNTN